MKLPICFAVVICLKRQQGPFRAYRMSPCRPCRRQFICTLTSLGSHDIYHAVVLQLSKMVLTAQAAAYALCQSTAVFWFS